MNPTGGDRNGASRRSFLLSGGGWLTGAWIAAHWPAIAAAHHAGDPSSDPAPAGLEFLSAAEAADVDAISNQIMPGGATPGAREAHALHFIDRALATFFSSWAGDFRAGLAEFQSVFRASHAASGSFAEAPAEEQIAHLETVDGTAFFNDVRTLTLLGMFSSPKYGGNFRGAGWKLMGFEDRHVFVPPFGYYDREYTGFVLPSAEKRP